MSDRQFRIIAKCPDRSKLKQTLIPRLIHINAAQTLEKPQYCRCLAFANKFSPPDLRGQLDRTTR